ncbi:site-specific DNA-methyltransferase [Dolosicoccus paucivorans]
MNAKRYTTEGVQYATEFSEEDNLILKGNNLLGLHTLKEKYAGKVKLIYIDPPYNTGGDSFIYNDNFNHSSWLTFMKSRLDIAHNLLKEDGCLFISLDDKEVHYLKVLADEIFGRENFITNICHKARASVSNDKIISNSHNHLLMYGKNEREIFNNKSNYGIPNILEGFNQRDEIGEYKLTPVDGPGGARKGNPYYEFLGVKGYWRYSKETMQELYDDNQIVKTQNNLQRKYYKKDAQKKKKTLTTWWDDNFLTSTATRELQKLFGEKVFNNPKNEYLLRRIIEFTTEENDIVLDFFMGSATTQAVAMKMNRRFIGIEQMDYINTVSVPRLQKIIEGEQGGISKDVNWQGGGSFVYAELMEKSKGYLESVLEAEDTDSLKQIYQLMLENVDLDFRTDLEQVQEMLNDAISLEDKKRLLVKVIDKNQLYYNYSEIDDANVRELISDNDYVFNQSFYKEEEIDGQEDQ